MKKWNMADIVIHLYGFTTILGTIVCICKKELYLAFKGILLTIFWISIILEYKSDNKNKIATKVSLITIIVLISLSILEIIN